MRTVSLVCLSLLTALGLASAAPAQTRRPLTDGDLVRLRWVADPQISPDGRQVAYVLVSVNERTPPRLRLELVP